MIFYQKTTSDGGGMILLFAIENAIKHCNVYSISCMMISVFGSENKLFYFFIFFIFIFKGERAQ